MTDAIPRIAVLIPCHNEAAAIGKVVDDFRRHVPEAVVYVFDNACTDATARVAREHGATVLFEPRLGKGFVVEGMFERIDADYYVIVDGDDTYPADKVRELLAPVMAGQADMTVGRRVVRDEGKPYRPLHVMGNRLVGGLVNLIFGCRLTDIMSGYRAFNRKVIARVPVVSAGFEVETEMTVQALYYQLLIVEVPVPYGPRPAGSVSKLRTFRDGARVLWKLFSLARAFKPLTFFGLVGLVLGALGVWAGVAPAQDYFVAPDHVTHLPRAVLATGLMILAAGCVFLGLILHAVNWRFKELHSVLCRGRSRSDAIDET